MCFAHVHYLPQVARIVDCVVVENAAVVEIVVVAAAVVDTAMVVGFVETDVVDETEAEIVGVVERFAVVVLVESLTVENWVTAVVENMVVDIVVVEFAATAVVDIAVVVVAVVDTAVTVVAVTVETVVADILSAALVDYFEMYLV